MPDTLASIDALAAELFPSEADNGQTPTGTETTNSGTPTSDTPAEGSSQTANDAGNADTEDPSLQQLLAAKKEANPELADALDAIYKEFQGGYTRKFESLSEQRKQFEGVDPNQIEALRQLQQMPPDQQIAWLEYQAEQIRLSQQGQPQYEDPYGALEGQLPAETVERLRYLEYVAQQQEKARITAEVDRTFTELQNQYGEIPQAERDEVLKFCTDKKLGVEDIPWAYRALNFDKAEKRGIEKGHNIRQQKEQTAQPPSSLAVRSAVADDQFDLRAAAEALVRG